MTAIGASRPLPRVPAKVASPNPKRLLRLDGGNWSSCPKAALRGSAIERPPWGGDLDFFASARRHNRSEQTEGPPERAQLRSRQTDLSRKPDTNPAPLASTDP